MYRSIQHAVQGAVAAAVLVTGLHAQQPVPSRPFQPSQPKPSAQPQPSKPQPRPFQQPQQPQRPKQPPRFQPKQPKPQQPNLQGRQPKGEAVATVNGDPITKAELGSAVKRQLGGQQVQPEVAQKIQKQSLNQLIESRLVEQHLDKKGPEVKDEEVDATVQRVKMQLQQQKMPFEKFLADRGYSETVFKKRIQGALAWRKYQQKELTKDSLQKHFEQNKDRFRGNSLDEVQQQVAQAYTAKLWAEIVANMRSDAKIKITDPQLRESAPRKPAPSTDEGDNRNNGEIRFRRP